MYQFNKAMVFRGRASQIAVCFVDEKGANLFTCGITGSSIRIENEDGSFIEKDAVTGIAWGLPESTYMYIYQLTPAETALLNKGNDLSLWLKIHFGENSMKYEFAKFLCVSDDVF